MTADTQVEPVSRPSNISIIGWLFLVTGVLSVIATPIFFTYREIIEGSWHNPAVNLDAAVVFFCIMAVCYIIAGYAILKGLAWGRTLYVVFGLIFVVLSFDLYNQALLAILSGLLPYIVLVWQLTRKPSNDWFAKA